MFVREAQPRVTVSVRDTDLEALFWERRFEDHPDDPWLADEDDAWLVELVPAAAAIDLPTVKWRPRPEDVVLPPISWRAP